MSSFLSSPSSASPPESATRSSDFSPASHSSPSPPTPLRPSSRLSRPPSRPPADARDDPPALFHPDHPSPSPSVDVEVRRRRREEAAKKKRMLERRTVIDIKKIKERGRGEEEEGKRKEEERKEREAKAEEIMRNIMKREEDRRNARSARKEQQAKIILSKEEKDELPSPKRPQPMEEEKEQIKPFPTPANTNHTFITSTHDVQHSPPLPSPPPAEEKESPPILLQAPVVVSPGEEGSESAYHAFINGRVQHMLVSNSIFIPVNSVLLPNTPHNASLSFSSRPPTPPPQFHLPSLQPPSSSFLPSSASISLASSDERALYYLLLFLSRIPLFSSLPLPAFFSLSRQIKEVRFDEFEVMANEGEQGDCLYLVKEGRIDTKLNLERNDKSDHTPPSSPPLSSSLGPLRRRFHSVNLAALDVACLTSHDICGESILLPPHIHLTSLISMTTSVCYAIPLSALPLLTPSTRHSLELYTRHSLALTRTFLAVRDRYRSSYHTSVVDFRLFVEGSLRRNLRHKNERGRMRKEIEEGGGEGGWGKDRDAHSQIEQAQRMEGRERGERGRREERVEDDGVPMRVKVESVKKSTRSVSLPPVFLSFTTLNLGDSVANSASSSRMSSAASRTGHLPLLSPTVVRDRVHPSLR